MSRREFQFIEGKSSKFWAIELSGKSFTVQWGRIGTAGQSQTKEFASEAAAAAEGNKLIADKIKKGYQEVGATSAAPASVKTVSAATEPAVANSAAAKPGSAKDAPTKDVSTQSVSTKGATATISDEPASNARPAITLKFERSIDLEEHERAAVTWHAHEPLARPEPRPFDLAARLADLAKISTKTYGWVWDWSTARIPVSLTPQESHFWLLAMCEACQSTTPKALAEQMAKQEFWQIDADEVRKLIKSKKTSLEPEVLAPLSNLLSDDGLIALMSEPPPARVLTRNQSTLSGDPEITLAFAHYILPYLTDEQKERLRQLVAPQIGPSNWPADHYTRPPAAFFLAAMLGLSDQLLAVVRHWPEGFYVTTGWDHTHYHQPQVIVFGLGNPQLVEAEMRRHKLPLNRPQYIRAWLAATGYSALDYIRDSILRITNRDECEKLLKHFTIVHAPEAAPHMLELKLSSKAPSIARAWLDSHLACTIVGLIPTASGQGKLADAAIEQLRDIHRAGHGELISQACNDEIPQRVRDEVLDRAEQNAVPFDAASTPRAIADAMKGEAGNATKSKQPGWLQPHLIPMLTVGEHRLNDDQAVALISALKSTQLGSTHPLISAVRQHVSRESRDAFVWRLFEMWQAEGAPAKEKWAMGAIGHLGSDASVYKLTPLVRAWPGESQHARAVYGLECLRGIGTDAALMALNGVAQKVKFKGLKTKAMEFMEEIAAQRNMSRAQLEDRIVPDCDLDQRGTRIFDFGPRQFRLVLGPEMKPMVKDADGKVKSDLPAPNSKDDAVKSREAVATWKLLKKQVKEVAKVQAERLEQAMITGRRWTPEEFDTLLLKHPLMINLARLVVWASYDDEGKLLGTFRITEDQTLADEKDEQTELPVGAVSVGVVHPAHLAKESLGAWGEIFSDYEIIAPFEQLGRRVNVLEEGEKSGTDFTRFAQTTVPAVTMVGILERLAWTRGVPQDGGAFHEHTKPYYGANVTCVMQYSPGVIIGMMLESEDQKEITTFFIPGIYKPGMYPDHRNRLKLGKVDPVVVSEMIRDVSIIASKAK